MEEIKASDQVKSHQMQISIPKCSVTKGAVRQKERRSPAGARRPQPSEIKAKGKHPGSWRKLDSEAEQRRWVLFTIFFTGKDVGPEAFTYLSIPCKR